MTATPFLGFGLAPAGTSMFGYGSPALADPNVGKALTKSDGSRGDARFIDPRTRDYAFDSTGRIQGIDAVQQLVYLALVTVRGSSAVASLGQAFTSVPLVTENIKAQMTNEVRQALSKLIADQLVTLNDVTVEITPQKAALIHVEWTDLTTNTISTVSI